jgi:hypothetical protein
LVILFLIFLFILFILFKKDRNVNIGQNRTLIGEREKPIKAIKNNILKTSGLLTSKSK